jgi:hypothetical protein
MVYRFKVACDLRLWKTLCLWQRPLLEHKHKSENLQDTKYFHASMTLQKFDVNHRGFHKICDKAAEYCFVVVFSSIRALTHFEIPRARPDILIGSI